MAAAFAGHLVYEYLTPGPDRLLRSGEPTGLYAEDARPAFKGMRAYVGICDLSRIDLASHHKCGARDT